MKLKEPVIRINLTCKNCDFDVMARTGNLNNFDAAMRAAATHVRQTGHFIEAHGAISPHVVETPAVEAV